MTSSTAMVSTRNRLLCFRICKNQLKRTMISDFLSDTSDERKPAKLDVEAHAKITKRACIVHKNKGQAIAASCMEMDI